MFAMQQAQCKQTNQYHQGFLRKMLGTQYGPAGTQNFPDSRDLILSHFRDPMINLSDSMDLIFNSRDPNRVPKTPQKT